MLKSPLNWEGTWAHELGSWLATRSSAHLKSPARVLSLGSRLCWLYSRCRWWCLSRAVFVQSWCEHQLSFFNLCCRVKKYRAGRWKHTLKSFWPQPSRVTDTFISCPQGPHCKHLMMALNFKVLTYYYYLPVSKVHGGEIYQSKK